MTAADEDWVTAAMADDDVVAGFLVGMSCDSPPLSKSDVLPLEWSVRQRRSKPLSVNSMKKQAGRGSPTTPLSWNGAASVSGGSGGCAAGGVGGSEESSGAARAKLFNWPGSKIHGESQKAALKKRRKKKNLVELKEEENFLIRERRDLKREVAVMRIHLEKERATNENLKRLKLELQSVITESTSLPDETMSCQPNPTASHSFTLIMLPAQSNKNITLQSSWSNASPEEKTQAASSSKFILPDLNVPVDEVQSSNAVC